ncbi:MAG: translocation protein TolB [Proteobacteria bacterium]|nr:translocation protein TolB [Pseudomonadota bacterium]
MGIRFLLSCMGAVCLCLNAPYLFAQENPGDKTGGSPAATSPSVAGDSGGQSVIQSQAIALGVDPLSLITVVPGAPPVRIPIAIPDTFRVGDAADSAGLGRTLAEVIRNDLKMSGLFEVLPVETYALVDPAKEGITRSTIQFDRWYSVGASVLAKTHYTLANDKATFHFALYDVDTATEIPLRFNARNATEANIRALGHEFVNRIIEFYTGEMGVFGTRIIFASDAQNNFRKIQSFETDGYGTITYNVPDAINVLPEWGPGNTILFTHLSSTGDHLYKYENGTLIQLSNFSGWASGADYCTKNGKIAFTGANEDNANIYTMNADGTDVFQVTNLPNNIQTSPSWSPDCSRMAFVSDYSGRPQIYIINADGTGMRRLTWVGNYNTTPDWSPKGDLIAFTARDERNVFDIFTINVATGEVTRLTQDQGHNKEPSWSPDGRYIVFESTRDGRQPRLYMMNKDGRWQTRLSPRAGLRTPTWHR